MKRKLSMKKLNNEQESLIREQDNSIDGQQMFELLGVVCNAVSNMQKLLSGVMEIQDKQNEAIVSIHNNIKILSDKMIEAEK